MLSSPFLSDFEILAAVSLVFFLLFTVSPADLRSWLEEDPILKLDFRSTFSDRRFLAGLGALLALFGAAELWLLWGVRS